MTLNEYTKSLTPDQREDFGIRLDSKWSYIKQFISGHRKPSATLAIKIERETGGLVKCEELCPDADWTYIRNTEPQDEVA